MLERGLLLHTVEDLRDGVAIADATAEDMPLVYVNPAFERSTGYAAEEALGRNCRYLQGEDRDQPALVTLRHGLATGTGCLVTLRNYRKNGTMFYNELSVSPVHNQDGTLTHFVGIQKDVTQLVLLQQSLLQDNEQLRSARDSLIDLATRDSLTGIHNRRYFDTQMPIVWQIARRNRQLVDVFMADIDRFKQFNDTYGHQAGDECLRRVAGALKSGFRRSADFVARYGGEEFVVLATGMSAEEAGAFGEELCQRIRALGISHEKNDAGVVTLSMGYAAVLPGENLTPEEALSAADQALYRAKRSGRDRVEAARAA